MPFAPLFNFGSPAIALRSPTRTVSPAVIQAPLAPPPPVFQPAPVTGGGATPVVCPVGTEWDPYAQACVPVGQGPTLSGNFPVTVTAPPTTVYVPPGAGDLGSGGEGPITVNVNNAVQVADASAASAIDSVAAAVRNGIYAGTNAAASQTNASIQAVQYGIDNLTTQLAGGINQGFTDIAGVINGIGSGISSSVGGIVGAVTNGIFASINPITSGLAGIVQIIASQIGGLAGQIAGAVAQVIPTIVAAIEGAISPGQAVISVISQEIGNAANSLAQISTDLGTAGVGLDATLQRLLSTWETYNTGFVEAQTGYPADGTLHSDLSKIWEALSGLVTTLSGVATPKFSDVITTTCEGINLQKLLGYSADWADVDQGIWKQFIKALWAWFQSVVKVVPVAFKYWDDYKHLIDQECPTERLPPEAVVQAVLRGFLTQTQGQSEAAQGNLNADRFQVLQHLAVHQMAPEQLVEALFRGLVTPSDYANALAAQGWTTGQGNVLQGIGFQLLTITELWELARRGTIDSPTLDAALKTLHYDDAQRKALASLTFRPANMQEAIDGAYSQEALQVLGASQEANPQGYPEFVSVAAAAEGLSIDATGARWVRHWETGSVGLWVDLYYRGLASPAQLQAVLRRNYIPDPLQSYVVEGSRPLLQFRTITRMVQLNLIDPSEGIRQLKRHGYSDADAASLINYAQATAKVPAAKRAAQTHAISIGIAKEEYVDGSISPAQFYDVLIAHGYTPEGANTEIAVINAHEAMLARKAAAQLIVDEYGAGLINEQVALAQLAAQGLTVAELAKYTHKIRAFRTKNAKLPTESELLKMLKAGIITKDEYINTLIGQGYPPVWANHFYELGNPANPQTTPAGSQTTPPPPTG